MRYTIRAVGLLGLLAAGCARPADIEQERNAILAQDRAWSATTTDMDKFMSYFAPDASIYPPGLPVATGTLAIRKASTEMFAAPGFSIHWMATMAFVGSGGDLGYTTGTYEMTMTDPAGKPMAETGKYVTVWKKGADGQWKVVEDIFNGDAPPPAPPPAS